MATLTAHKALNSRAFLSADPRLRGRKPRVSGRVARGADSVTLQDPHWRESDFALLARLELPGYKHCLNHGPAAGAGGLLTLPGARLANEPVVRHDSVVARRVSRVRVQHVHCDLLVWSAHNYGIEDAAMARVKAPYARTQRGRRWTHRGGSCWSWAVRASGPPRARHTTSALDPCLMQMVMEKTDDYGSMCLPG